MTHRPTWRPLLGIVAGLLAIRALDEAQRARRAEREYPPRGRRITVNGVALHVTDQGEGPPIVLLHGNGATAEEMHRSGLVAALARTNRVIVFDRPGFGFSDRPRARSWDARSQASLLFAALDLMQIGRAVVVGHSWGTLVALAMALERPDRVAGLALVSGFYFVQPRCDVLALLPSAMPGFGDVLRYTVLPPLMRALRNPAYRKLFGPAPVPPAFLLGFPFDLAVRPSQLRAVAGDTATLQSSARALQSRYATLRMPVAIVSGAQDRIVDPRLHAERLHRTIAHATLTVLQKEGHMVHHTAPAQVLRAIHDLLDEVDERGFAQAQLAKERRGAQA